MRRLLVKVSTLGVLLAVMGCHHTAGVCDCDPGWSPCIYPPYGGTHIVTHATAAPAAQIKVEAIKEMPKPTDGK